MATKKKTQKKKKNKPRGKLTVRQSSKKAASGRSRRIATKAKTTKTKAKTRPKKTIAAKSLRPRKAGGTTTTPRETVRVFRSSLPTREESQSVETVDLDLKGLGSKSGGQSGDLQGLSNVESADSESVGELLEEGNAFEAEIVKGVQDAPDADESEVQTHQGREEEDLPEDFREN